MDEPKERPVTTPLEKIRTGAIVRLPNALTIKVLSSGPVGKDYWSMKVEYDHLPDTRPWMLHGRRTDRYDVVTNPADIAQPLTFR